MLLTSTAEPDAQAKRSALALRASGARLNSSVAYEGLRRSLGRAELDRKNSFHYSTIAPNIKQLSKWVFLCVSQFFKRPIASSSFRSASFSRGSAKCCPSFQQISHRSPSGLSSSSWPNRAEPCWPTMRFGERSKWSDAKTSTLRPSRKSVHRRRPRSIPRGNVLTVPTTSSRRCFGTILVLLRMRLLRIDAAVDLEFRPFLCRHRHRGARIRVGCIVARKVRIAAT